MEATRSFYEELKGWPWRLFLKLNPLFKIIVVVLAIAVWVPDPLDIIAISVWGIVAGLLLQQVMATWVVVALGILFWVTIQILESLLVFIVMTYVIPGVIGLVCWFTESDPYKILFNK